MAIAAGTRITVRDEDFLVTEVRQNHDHTHIIEAEGISELVRGKRFVFDTAIDQDIQVLAPEHTELIADQESGYRRTKLYLETQVRNASIFSEQIAVAHKAAFDLADYQLTPTLQALKAARPRILIADGVGLGKTVEVGIFLAELIKRGKGDRILVLALKSILGQFQQEIWNRFAIPLVRLDSAGIERLKTQLPANKNPFDFYDRTIISIDTLKNNAKFRHYIEKSRWDVVVIDECHTVANAQSQRGDLAQFLARRCESLVLTSATPHNGKRESFANLIKMIEPTAVPLSGEIEKDKVAPYFVRRFKNDIIEDDIRANFQDRKIVPIRTALETAEEDFLAFQQKLKQRSLEDTKGKKKSQDLLFSIGLFKAYLSSPAAALSTLNNRIKRVQEKGQQIADDSIQDDLNLLEEAKQLVQSVLKTRADSKYQAFNTQLDLLKWKGRPGDDRIVVFAERIDTLKYLKTQLEKDFALGEDRIQLFHGGLSDIEQQAVIEDFGKADSSIRVLLTSDAGAQGVNLHYFCNHMFNYDIPWSLITLEQRNGRIDRYGQKRTPYIYYLIAESEQDNLKTDLYIIEKLTEKEEEVYKALGDAGAVMHLYDSDKEEERTRDAIIAGETDFLDAEDDEDDFDFTSLFAEEEETTAAVITDDPIRKTVSFYSSDFSFYSNLVEYLKSRGAVPPQSIEVGVDTLLEVQNTKELEAVLYDLPPEAKPSLGSVYQLTTDKATVQGAIEEARRRKGDWAQFQILYDLHPIVRFLMTKLEADIDKGVAPVARTSRLPMGSRYYVFHGQVSNQLGQPVFSDFFVIGLDNDGGLLERPTALQTFVKENDLHENLYTERIEKRELESLSNTLKDAIDYANSMHMLQQQQILQAQMEEKQNHYKEQLKAWKQDSDAQIELEFADKAESGFLRIRKKDRIDEVETILSEKSRFFTDMTQLNNDAYLKLLAVFYNP